MTDQTPYKPTNKVRIVTAASLFDGHDAAINIMRRIIQSTGCEVIHLGHDRSVEEVVNTAIQEDANAICLTSYQGGHNEYFKYMYDLLKERGSEHIKIFGGGGGVILPSEIKELMDYGITRIYSPDDGREMGLQGMINDLVEKSDFAIGDRLNGEVDMLSTKNPKAIARVISSAENFPEVAKQTLDIIHSKNQSSHTPVLGITGTGGAGKSSLVDELVRRFLIDFPTKTVGLVSVDPSKRKTSALLLPDNAADISHFSANSCEFLCVRHGAAAVVMRQKLTGTAPFLLHRIGAALAQAEQNKYFAISHRNPTS